MVTLQSESQLWLQVANNRRPDEESLPHLGSASREAATVLGLRSTGSRDNMPPSSVSLLVYSTGGNKITSDTLATTHVKRVGLRLDKKRVPPSKWQLPM